jgi:hypothetical protein
MARRKQEQDRLVAPGKASGLFPMKHTGAGNPYAETMPVGSRVQLTCGVREIQHLTFIPKGSTGTITGYTRPGISPEDTRWLLSVRLDNPVKGVQVLLCWPAEVSLVEGQEPMAH